MATKGGVKVPIGANTKPLKKGLDDAEGRLKKFGATAGKLSAAAGVAIGGGLAAAGAAIGKTLLDADKARSEMLRATGAFGAEAAAQMDAMMRTMAQVPDDMSVVAGAFGSVRTHVQGTDEDVTRLTRDMLDFARVTGADATKVADDLGNALAAWKIDAATADLDAFTAVTMESGIGADALSDALKRQGPALQALGLDINQAAVFLGDLHEAGARSTNVPTMLAKLSKWAVEEGHHPSDALAALRQQLKDTPDPADKMALAMDVLGATIGPKLMGPIEDGTLSVEGFNKALEDSDGVLARSAVEHASAGEKIKEALNGVRSEIVIRLMPAFDQLADWALEKAPQAQASLIAFGEESASAMKSLSEQARSTSEELAGVAAPKLIDLADAAGVDLGDEKKLGKQLEQAATGFLTGAGGGAAIGAKLGGPKGAIAGALIGGVAGAAAPFHEEIRGLVDDAATAVREAAPGIWEGLKEGVGQAVVEVRALNEEFQRTGAELAVVGESQAGEKMGKMQTVVAGLADAFVSLEGPAEFFFEGIKEIGGAGWDVIQTALDLFRDVWDMLQPHLERFVDILVEHGMPILKELGELIRVVVVPVLLTLGGILARVGAWLLKIAGFVLKVLGPPLLWVADTVLGMFLNVLNLVLGVLKNVLGFVVDVFKGDFSAAWEHIKGIFSAVWTFILDTLGLLGGKLWGLIKGAFNKLLGLAGFLIGVGKDIAGWFWEKIKGMVTDAPGKLWDGIKTAFKGLLGLGADLLGWGSDLMGDFWGGIQDFITDAPGKLWDGLYDAFHGLLDLGTDFKDWATELAGDFIGKIVEFIKGSPSTMINAVLEMLAKVAEGMPWIGGKVADWLRDRKVGVAAAAMGGIATRPTLTMLGEAGPEAVVPLSRAPGGRPLPGAQIVINVHAGVITDPGAVGREIRSAVQWYDRRVSGGTLA